MSLLFGIREVKEIQGEEKVNELLKEGWILLETITNPEGITYIIGRLEPRKF